jgi:hypothetical protein
MSSLTRHPGTPEQQHPEDDLGVLWDKHLHPLLGLLGPSTKPWQTMEKVGAYYHNAIIH